MSGPPPARIVFHRAAVQAATARLGAEISSVYPEGVVLAAVLPGSVFLLADLVRRITTPCEVDFLAVSDFAGGAGRARIVKDLDRDVHGRHVVVVEDLVDTGLTCSYLRSALTAHGPASVQVCALLDRRSRRIVPVPLRFVGFEAPEDLLIGCGLGTAGRYRNLPFVAAADPDVLARDPDAYVRELYPPIDQRTDADGDP